MESDWKIGQVYGFVPSGDASELIIKIVQKVPYSEAQRWFVHTYDRPVQGEGSAYKAVIVKGGQDVDITHRKGEAYYVFSSDFAPGDEVRLIENETEFPGVNV